jgi:hypothetical protein
MSGVVGLGERRASASRYPPAAADERFVAHPADLEVFLDDAVAIAVWVRSSPRLTEVGRILARSSVRLEEAIGVGPEAAARVVARALDGIGADTGPLAEDVQRLVTLFVDLVGAERVGLRLLSLAHAMCPRFHVDRVPVRLLCTYAGPSTEWCAGADADRRALRALVSSGACEPCLRPGAIIRSARPVDVVLFKGDAWPGREGHGVVHRSPSVEGDRRLFLSVEAQ